MDARSPSPAFHCLSAGEAFAALGTGAGGLSSLEVEARRARYGPNELPRARPPGLLRLYLRQFRSPLIYLLLVAAAVSLGLGERTDALFIFAVLQINAAIGAAQERRAQARALALEGYVQSVVLVTRDGRRQRVPAAALVPGDLVHLESGVQVPADVRLTRAHDLRVDESLLTGESLPVEKDPGAAVGEGAAIGERLNMVHAGTLVLGGRATGAVCATGAATELGRIATALAAEDPALPPLVIRLRRFTRAIAGVILAAIALLAVAQLLRGAGLFEVFLVAVALAVSAIPEGLPVAITVTLSVATSRMARRRVIVRALPAVEGLGACTVVASDKTGTLTANELTARRVWLPGLPEIEVGGEGYRPEGEASLAGRPLEAPARARLERLAASGALCNEAGLARVDGARVHHGDTVDVAFLALAGKLGLERERLLERYPERGLVPFEPHRRFAAAFHEHDGRLVAHVKGAAETLAPMCRGIAAAEVLAQAERMAAGGYRVLAVASGEVAAPEAAELRGLDFLGLVGLIDPTRPEVPGAVERCRRAGISVRMVTGDHPATALAIARELGIAGPDETAVTGEQLAALGGDRAGLDAAVAGARVFARVAPIQKLDVVESLERAGHFVAVTGDGVNDAPALKAAHIGIAMGRGGTDVARGAADLILTDDNFASIVDGIEDGRVAYDNVRKVILLLVSTGAAEIALFFLAFFAALPLPLFPVQLLWLNLVTNGIQHVALALEPGEPGVLARRPRSPEEPIFDRRMIEQSALAGLTIGLVGFGFFGWALGRWSEAEARNGLLLLMVLFENVHVFNCRSETRSAFRMPLSANPLLLLAVLGAQAVHLGAMYVPGLAGLLGIRPVGAGPWLLVFGLALSVLVVFELYKALRPAGPAASGAAG